VHDLKFNIAQLNQPNFVHFLSASLKIHVFGLYWEGCCKYQQVPTTSHWPNDNVSLTNLDSPKNTHVPFQKATLWSFFVTPVFGRDEI